MNKSEEQAYIQGSRAVWSRVLYECLTHLDHDGSEEAGASWIVEREDIIVALRSLCREFGDNDWPNSLDLGDVIEKHLARHLYLREEVK